MSLSVTEKQLITDSFALMADNKSAFAAHFYDCLFELAPIIKPMFVSDRNVIEMHFVEIIETAVDKIHNFEELETTLIELGEGHKQYKVKASQFALIKTALVLSLEYLLRERCSDAIVAAWSHYVDEISALMIQGLEKVS